MRKLFALVLIALSIASQAQDTKQQWVHFTTADLQANNIIRSTAFDSKGRPWVCASNGVSKFENGKWTYTKITFGKDTGSLTTISFDKNDVIWAGGFSIGAFSYKEKILSTLSTDDGLVNSNVISIAQDKDGAQWIGHWPGGISKNENGKVSAYTKINDLAIGMPYMTIFDSQNSKWFATSNGLLKFDGLNWTRLSTNDGLANNCVRSVAIDSKGIIWAGTETALCRYDGQNWTSYTTKDGLSGNRVSDMKFDTNGSLWCITDNGLSVFNGTAWTTYVPTSFITNSIENIVIDIRGNKWIAEENGVYIFNENGVDLTSPINAARPKISGTVYFDKNHNKVLDAQESVIKNQKVLLRPDSIYTYTDQNGVYSFTVDSLKTYSIEILPQLPYQKGDVALVSSLTTSSKDANIGSIGLWGKDSVGFQSTISSGIHRCGRIMPFYYTYRNTGTAASKTGVVVAIDKKVTLNKAIPAADSVGTDNRLFWKNLNVAASEDVQIQLQLNIPAGTMDTMSYAASVFMADKTFSADSVKLSTRCSYDPNDIQVHPAGLGSANYTLKNKNLKYTIRFQNTGNDTAYDIRIVDTLSSNLDWSSLAINASSHKVRTEISKTGVATFYFDSIMLPHSGKDYVGSNGFVSYTIKAKTSIAENAEIKNTAHIIFDQNPAVVTNTTRNTMVSKYPCSIYNLLAAKQITNCESVQLNGSTYTESGTYTQILKSKSGCDSTLTLAVKVLKKTAHTKQIVAFKKYELAKRVFESSTTIDSTLTNHAGCDSLLKYLIIITSVAGDKNGNGTIDSQEKAGDINANDIFDGKELAGDVNGNNVYDSNEIAGDINGDGSIGGSELKGDANGNGLIEATEKQAYLLSIENANTIKQALQIHPNPVGNELLITLPDNVTATAVKIIDINGRVALVATASDLGNTVKIDTKSLQAGIYTVQLQINGEWISAEIVKN